MSEVKVSVIVPVYRVETGYLKECLDSLIKQTLEDIEIILVDDGAPKENASLCDYYAEKDNRFIVIHQENAGVSAARNAGLARHTGKYVTFVDSDDTVDKRALEKAYDFAERNELEVTIFGILRIYSDHKTEYAPFVQSIPLLNEKQKDMLELKAFAGDLPVYDKLCTKCGSGACCAKLYLSDLIRTNNLSYPVGIVRSEDVNFNLRAFDAADRIGYLDEFMYFYRQLSDSASYKYRDGGIKVFADAAQAMRQFLSDSKKNDYFRPVFYMRCMFFFLESMEMDYMNPENKKPLKTKLKEMRDAAGREPFAEAFTNLKYENLTMAKRIPLFLIRLKAMYLLSVFFKTYRKLSLYRWRDDFLAGGQAQLEGKRGIPNALSKEVSQLRREIETREQVIGELTVANRILKKLSGPSD